MKITRPAKEVEVCDFCQSDSYLQECHVCHKKYCLVHDGLVAGSFGFTTICRDCARRVDVHVVCEKYAKRLAPIYKARNEALKRLPVYLDGEKVEG